MKKFIYKSAATLTLFVILLYGLLTVTSILVKSRGFENYNTESNLLFLDEDQDYDLLIMGISHARNFSRYHNHLLLEKALNKKIINIGQGNGVCGAREQLFYLDYFYYKKNSTKRIIYVLSPPLLFSKTLPVASNTFDIEPFDLTFLIRYLEFDSNNKSERVFSYLQSKLRPHWLFLKPETLTQQSSYLDSLNMEAVKAGQDFAYGGTQLDMQAFSNATNDIETTIKIGLKNDSEITLLIPPALFGKWRGHSQVVNFALELKNKYNNKISVYDASETILDPKMYYDNHHLNTRGVELFINNDLKPFLKNSN